MRNEARRCVDTFKTEYSDTVCRIGEVLLSFGSGILTVVTFGTSFWLQATDKKDSTSLFHHGLWQNCSSETGDSVCNTLPLSGDSKSSHFGYP